MNGTREVVMLIVNKWIAGFTDAVGIQQLKGVYTIIVKSKQVQQLVLQCLFLNIVMFASIHLVFVSILLPLIPLGMDQVFSPRIVAMIVYAANLIYYVGSLVSPPLP
jgi:hypothetical protein